MIKETIKIIVILYFAVMSFLFFVIAQKWVSNEDTDLKIKKEAHIASLIGQYHADLGSCIQDTQNEKQCIDTMNDSNLAKLIINWGYGESLAKN